MIKYHAHAGHLELEVQNMYLLQVPGILHVHMYRLQYILVQHMYLLFSMIQYNTHTGHLEFKVKNI